MIKPTHTKRFALALVALFLLALPAFAQYTSSEIKKVEKSKALYNKGKYSKAISAIKPVIDAHPFEDDLWKLRVIYEADRYNDQLNKDVMAIIKKAGKGGSGTINFNKLKSTEYSTEMLSACYLATLFCSKQEYASLLLRNKLIDVNPDTAISDDAKEEYNKGEEEFRAEKYTSAIKHYQKAVDLDGKYYKARLYIGDSYYNNEEYEKALPWFKEAIERQPKLLEPRKYLTDSYMKLKRWDEAYKACIEAITVHPDIGMFVRMEEICEKLGKTFNRHWMIRTSFPNIAGNDQSAISSEPWKYYREAKEKIERYCDEDGVITKSQTLTEQKYMETYCWEYMLKKSDDNDGEMGFAHKMMDEGYLDCFVFVSMYHITISEQAEHFSENNAGKIKKYFDTYLVK
jgi:tetratricopeptide (TPR) repeat protein